MTKLELLTHPSIQSLNNTKDSLKIEFKPIASNISITSLLHCLKNETGAEITKIDDYNFIFDKPLKTDKRKKIWFSILKGGVVFQRQDNITDAQTAEEVVDHFQEGEMAIGIDIDKISIKTNFDSSEKYTWVLIYENGEISISGSLPEDKMNIEDVLFMIENINEMTKNKVIGLDAIVG